MTPIVIPICKESVSDNERVCECFEVGPVLARTCGRRWTFKLTELDVPSHSFNFTYNVCTISQAVHLRSWSTCCYRAVCFKTTSKMPKTWPWLCDCVARRDATEAMCCLSKTSCGVPSLWKCRTMQHQDHRNSSAVKPSWTH